MYALIYLLFLCTVLDTDASRSAVEPYVETVDERCVSVTDIPQDFFAEVTFLNIDTGCVPGMLHDFSKRPLRIAFDSGGQSYRLFNFADCEFNTLVEDHPPQVDSQNIYEYGRFFLNVTQIYAYSERDYTIIESSGQLKTVNREHYRWSMVLTDHEFEARSRQIDSRISCLATLLDAPRVDSDSLRGGWSIHYYVWYARSGDLRMITLSIAPDFRCWVDCDEIIAQQIGYYLRFGGGDLPEDTDSESVTE